MKFEHLVQINVPLNPLNPLIDSLTADQVWRGLVRKAENPLLFVYALDEFRILGRNADSIDRELRFGRLTIRDRVTFAAPEHITQVIEASAEVPASTLATSIEAPDTEQLYVRFRYETGSIAGGAPVDETTAAFLKQAYVEADNDVIRTIRRLAAEGKL